MGRVSELHDWELELYLDDWRERKAQRVSNPASAQAVSASGRDQHNQRMEANRERFARQAGQMAQATAHERGWHRLIAFGDERYSSRFADGFSNSCELQFVDSSDLVGQPAKAIVDRVDGLLPDLRRRRETALVERLGESAYANGKAALGHQETMQALEAARVDRLLYDSRLPSLEVEQMIELAVPSGAAVTARGDVAGSRLESHGGVAAFLRY
jgi:stalled ribosome rescue protein Dom34